MVRVNQKFHNHKFARDQKSRDKPTVLQKSRAITHLL